MWDVFRLHVERLEGLDGIFSIAPQQSLDKQLFGVPDE